MAHSDDARVTQTIDTQLVHAGERRPRIHGAAVLPVFRSTVFEHRGSVGYHDVRYPRLSNSPNHEVLADKLAVLERGEAAVVTASGMAAISTTLLTVLAGGGHLLAQSCLYGGTHDLLAKDFGDLGIEIDFIDATNPAEWERHVRSNTRAVYVEALTNPLVEVADHLAVLELARRHQLVSIIDNTFATPVNFQPLTLGFDLCVHSATKYLNGHSDVVAGVIVGAREWLSRIKHRLDHLGGCLDAGACALLHRGIKTLALRVRRQNQSAVELASWLDRHPSVARVSHPSLPSHPHHDRARALMRGFGGMLAFELTGGVAAAEQLIERLEIPIHAPSLGGVETLITRPATTSHAGMAPEARTALGITDGLMRVSVGIEDPEDLIADFERALSLLPA